MRKRQLHRDQRDLPCQPLCSTKRRLHRHEAQVSHHRMHLGLSHTAAPERAPSYVKKIKNNNNRKNGEKRGEGKSSQPSHDGCRYGKYSSGWTHSKLVRPSGFEERQDNTLPGKVIHPAGRWNVLGTPR
ncbi:hypothetical protein CGRA01v4_05511 [Colletotrichum graminicola]|nr:hypothetical protein CGRA01v4_05511 [Colletotrichum graminicola]